MRIPVIYWRGRERSAIHFLADGLLHGAECSFGEVELATGVFGHDPMMPRIGGSRIPCGNHTDPLPENETVVGKLSDPRPKRSFLKLAYPLICCFALAMKSSTCCFCG